MVNSWIANPISRLLVALYRFWHGTLGLPGMGWLLRRAARRLEPLQNFPLPIDSIGTVPVNFTDVSAFAWLNHTLGDPEPETGLLKFILSNFNNDGVFWDVGANIGTVGGLVLRHFPRARYFLFEPNPDLAKQLRALFAGHPNVSVAETALSRQSGTALFSIPDGNSTLAGIASAADGQARPVILTAGDDFLSSPSALAPTLIKIDVEGHEPETLAGCVGLIGKYRPTIIFEHLFLSAETVRNLIPRGYRLFYLHDQSGELSPALDPANSHNAVLLADQP
ncbi:MAG: FkbM family methyltransferase [Verrucomicrobiales bacterium]|jgi:FkbM family methyltransferase|nr:FkbM family methyltransferase [Verrucomicrobiales bacterium]